ncbi:50S ribosomal protein L10 [Candidatus Johnevansia muelleri]|uniref:Large ribosomal subunit protein uL10 n=1 Tax=Candidatus Johnevansia muelleri TaxID=1495769 RepID=A0A078KDS2_9GAMM|nr:50S ribosomal protein L10 [Candidatus Evansia muelleri]
MILGIEKKKSIVYNVNKIAKVAYSLVIADYHGVAGEIMSKLRKQAHVHCVYLSVIRNTLAKRAIYGTAFECLTKSLVGPTILVFSMKHPRDGAQLIKEFYKNNEIFNIKALAYDGKFISGENIDKLANLPTYKEAIAKIMYVIKEASIVKLIRIIAAIKNKKI